MEVEISKSDKVILGYKLNAKIGAGGFGEVWSAEAPGGLQKAVKLVHGYHDEERAQSELKSLDRIKAIRHPFLLSLERIEVVDGQLVIVSELADECLADVFHRYAENGFDGIDREKLVAYMKDAAEALDDLSAKHSLQHLDVKPENLLIFGDHVKIADFGLVKDVNDCNQSMVTGMTPAYAAPEIFDGRPSSKSDQYALAIVFQEMLTGIRPFDGSTSAQLAAQHLYGKPNLLPLPKSDQPVLAKALNRDPLHRFSSCSEFVSDLANRKIRKKVVLGLNPLHRNIREPNATEVLPTTTQVEQTALISGENLPFHERELEKLPPPEFNTHREWLQPVLIVSIGKMACSIANQLNSKLIGRHGGMKNIPAIQTLCIDSDQAAIDELISSENKTFIANEDVICTPLKKSEFYRNQAASKLAWINRRWIYNIPRSQQTEGIRPLGRLVFADHFEQLCDALRGKILQATAAENLATTSETLEVNVCKQIKPRVVVIGSIGGGIGGMFFDIGYLIRTLLSEEGFDSPDMTALMTHSINSRQQNAELSNANATSTFSELRHYVDFGYPGDSALGIPEFDDQPFDNVYFHELENDLRQTEINRCHSDIAEWIFSSTASNTVPFFEGCRQTRDESDNFELRTFGIKSCGPCERNGLFEESNQLIVDLLTRWQDGSSTSNVSESINGGRSLSDQTVGFTELFERLQKHLNCEVSPQYCNSLVTQSKELMMQSANISSVLKQLYRDVIGLPKHEREFGYQPTSLENRFEKTIGEISEQDGSRVAACLSSLLQGESLNLKIVSDQLRQISVKQEGIVEELAAARLKFNSDEQNLLDQMREFKSSGKPKQSNIDIDAILRNYQELILKVFLLRYCESYANATKALITELEASAERSRQQLIGIQERFTKPFNISPSDDDFSLVKLVDDYVEKFKSENMQKLEHRLYVKTIEPAGGYIAVLEDAHMVQRVLPGDLELFATELISQTLSSVSIDKVIAEKQLPPEQIIRLLNEQLNQALPRLQSCGGGIRLLISTPRLGGQSFIHNIASRHFGIEAASLCGTHGDLVFCFEGEDVSLAAVAKRLTEGNPRALVLSQKVHCRNDIEWSKIDDLF